MQQKYEAANYTTDSYTVLAATVNADNMNALKTSGTAEQIAEAVQSIRNAIDGLVLRATDMDAYRDKIQFKSEAGDYTEETYTEYKGSLRCTDGTGQQYRKCISR